MAPWYALLAACGVAGPVRARAVGEVQLPPVLGVANEDNEYRQRRVPIATYTLESDPTGVNLIGDATYTTDPAEVISGTRSVRITGDGSGVEIDPFTVFIQPGQVYALEYDYRVLDDAGFGTVMTVLGRWGDPAVLHPDPWGVSPTVFGMQGTQRRQFRFGEGGYPTFWISTGGPAVVVVDNLRVWAIDAEVARSNPKVFSFGFPRVSNYFYDTPFTRGAFNGVTAASIEDVLGRYDLINGVQIDNTVGDTSWIERIRDRNGSAVIVPYRLSYSAQQLGNAEPVGGTSDLQGIFNSSIPPEWIMRQPDGTPLADLNFEGNTQLDPTEYCEPVSGMVFADYMEHFIGDTVLPAGLWTGIHFDQAEWYPNPLLSETINGPLPPFDIDRDGQPDPNSLMWGEMRKAFDSYFKRMRERMGPSRVIFGNPGRIPLDTTVTSQLNGIQQEIESPYLIEENGDWNTHRSAKWHDLLRNYLSATYAARAPQAVSVQFTGLGLGTPTGEFTGHGYPNRDPAPEARDYQRVRLGLATALMGDGFFGYDYVDNTTPPAWFDEYSVDATGHPTTDLSGKGYLGQPVGACAEIVRSAPVVLETGFEGEVPPGLFVGAEAFYTTEPWQVIEGSASLAIPSGSGDYPLVFLTDPGTYPLEVGKTYDLRARFRVISYAPDEFRGFLTMGITSDLGAVDFFGRSYAYHQDVQGVGQTIEMRTQVKVTDPGAVAFAYFGDPGTVSLDSFRLAELGGGAFRRDFENGIAIVNPTPAPISLTQAEVSGPMGRTGIRRISGVQDPDVNSGGAVTNGITIPSGDGIILLADHVGAPLPVAPTIVAAVPDGVDASAHVYWDLPPGGTTAGHIVQYRIAGTLEWDRWVTVGPGDTAALEFLHPGTTYDVRVATFDFAARVSGFGPVAQVSTAGATPVRGSIIWISPMERGRYATMAGTMLAQSTQDLSNALPREFEGTAVRVNGVPAPLSFVSPDVVGFLVPGEIAVGEAIVRVERDGFESAGYVADVAEAPGPACPGDATGDGRVNSSDFNVIATHFGMHVPVGTDGDVTFDGIVNSADFNVMAGGFGCGG